MPGKAKIPYAQIVSEFQKHQSVIDVAVALGLSDQTVYRALKMSGVEIPKREEPGDQEIIEAYHSLGSGTEVAKLFHADNKRVYGILRNNGIDTKKERNQRLRIVPEDQEKSVVETYKSGKSMWKIAASYGCSASAIMEVLKRNNVKTRQRKLNLPVDEVHRLYQSGLNYTEVADRMGCHYNTIMRIISKEFPESARPKSGPGGPRWRGGEFTHHGYIYTWVAADDPFVSMAEKHGPNLYYALKHRLVMARHLGRVLSKSETVHHINGNTADCELANLQLRKGKHGKHQVHRCRKCGSTDIETIALSEVDTRGQFALPV